jgi:hypothetical protein
MPIQVVVPSVSRAKTLHGADLTGSRGTSRSGSGAAIGGWLAGGATPTVVGAEGGAAAGGGALVAPGVCCADSGEDTRTMQTAMEALKVARRIGASLEMAEAEPPRQVKVPVRPGDGRSLGDRVPNIAGF